MDPCARAGARGYGGRGRQQDRGRFCGWVIGLSVVLAGGCASLPESERAVLIQANRQYAQGDFAAAAASLDRLIRDYGQTQEIAEAHYLRGLCRFNQQQREAAAQDFERGIEKSNRADLTARCQASLASIAYQRGHWTRAAGLYAGSVKDLPDAPPTDTILYAAGMAMQRAGEWQQARLQFARILNRFRDRPIASDARRMAAWRHAFFSIQLGAFRDADKAGTAVYQYRQKGLDAWQENLPRGKDALWIVMAGRYGDYAQALSALERVRRIEPKAAVLP